MTSTQNNTSKGKETMNENINSILTSWTRRGAEWLAEEFDRVGIVADKSEYYMDTNLTSSQRRQGLRTLEKHLRANASPSQVREIAMFADDDIDEN